MSNIEEKLNIIADYSPRKQNSQWGLKWWKDYYINMLSEGYFLPPYLSYIIFSSCNIDNNNQEPEKKIKKFECYKFLSNSINLIAKKCMNNEKNSNSKSFKLGKYFAFQISCRYISKNKDSIDCNIFFPNEVLEKEVDCLEKEDSSLAFEDKWLRELICNRNINELISKLNLIPFIGREKTISDPFISYYLKNDLKKFFEYSNVCGDHKRADNKSHIVGPVGKFEKMDTGKLPDSIDRLSPFDLTLLYKGMNINQINSLQKTCRNYFFLRASNGELWQKYSSRIAESNKMPSVIIQIDFLDDIEFHKITNPPLAPRVSFYRALIVSLITKLISYSKKFNWSLNFLIKHRLFNKYEAVFIADEKIMNFGSNKEDILKYLMTQIPSTFISGLSVNTSKEFIPNEYIEYDLWARIVLGGKIERREKENQDSLFSCNDEIGIKVEYDEIGRILLRESYSAEEADEIKLERENDRIDNQLSEENKSFYQKNKSEFMANMITNIISGNQEMSMFE